MSQAPLDRARALLSLAMSTTENGEARNALKQLKQLIDEHGYTLESKDTAEPVPPFSHEWQALFFAVDPEKGSPELFCHALGWTPSELKAIARNGRRLADHKLLKLVEFCQRNNLGFPLEEQHPGFQRLRTIHNQRRKQLNLLRENETIFGTAQRVARNVASNVSVGDVIDIVTGRKR